MPDAQPSEGTATVSCQSIELLLTGKPDVKNKYGSGSIRPERVVFYYLNDRINAHLYGLWVREDGELTDAPCDQLYRFDDTDWPDWLRELAAARDPRPASTEEIADADNPTHLRWGHNDVLWGDDDTVTILLSGPDREPYALELDPERAAALRQDLAGPGEEHPAVPPIADRAALRDRIITALDNAHTTHPCPALGDQYWSGCVHYDEAGRMVGVGSCHSGRRADAVLSVLTASSDRAAELETENARMRHELEVMYGGAFDSLRGAEERDEEALDLADGPVRCPLCPYPVTLHTPNGARAHFTTVHPEQRITGPGPWPLLATDGDEEQQAQTQARDALMAAHVALAEQAGRDQAALARVRQLHDRLAEDTDLSGPDDLITKGSAARRIATALDGWNPALLPTCPVEFEGGGTCAKPAGHRPPGSDDPHVPAAPTAVVAEPAPDPVHVGVGANTATCPACKASANPPPYPWMCPGPPATDDEDSEGDNDA